MSKLNKRHRSRVKAIDVNHIYSRTQVDLHRVSFRRKDGYGRMHSHEYHPTPASLRRVILLTLSCSVAHYQVTAYP